MPILGDMNNKNELYRKQINDVLDYDRNINKQVVENIKKQISIFNEPVVPQNTIVNEQSLKNIYESAGKIIKDLYAENERLISKGEIDTAILGRVIVEYNIIARQIKNPSLNTQEKKKGENIATEILPYLRNILNTMKTVIDSLLYEELVERPNHRPNFQQLTNLKNVVSTYALYSLIYENIDRNKYSQLTLSDVENKYSQIVMKEFPTFKEIELLKDAYTPKTLEFLEARIKLIEEEEGRRLTENEINRIKDSFISNPIYKPVFTKNVISELETKSDCVIS